MFQELRFALYTIGKNIQSSAELRGAFLMNILGMLLNNCAFVALWVFFTQSVGEIGGWQPADIIGLQGFVALTLGAVFSFTGGVRKLPQYIMHGTFDRFMLSPKNVLMRVATSYMSISSLADVIFGIVFLTIYAVIMQFSLMQIGLMIFLALIATVLFFSVIVAIFSLGFLMMDASSMTMGLFELFLTPAMYHGGAFQGGLRFVFTFILPSLLIGTVPVEILRNFSWEQVFVLVGITIGWAVFAVFIFYRCIRKYESSNFISFGV